MGVYVVERLNMKFDKKEKIDIAKAILESGIEISDPINAQNILAFIKQWKNNRFAHFPLESVDSIAQLEGQAQSNKAAMLEDLVRPLATRIVKIPAVVKETFLALYDRLCHSSDWKVDSKLEKGIVLDVLADYLPLLILIAQISRSIDDSSVWNTLNGSYTSVARILENSLDLANCHDLRMSFVDCVAVIKFFEDRLPNLLQPVRELVHKSFSHPKETGIYRAQIILRLSDVMRSVIIDSFTYAIDYKGAWRVVEKWIKED